MHVALTYQCGFIPLKQDVQMMSEASGHYLSSHTTIDWNSSGGRDQILPSNIDIEGLSKS
jgi:hypothetical protein